MQRLGVSYFPPAAILHQLWVHPRSNVAVLTGKKPMAAKPWFHMLVGGPVWFSEACAMLWRCLQRHLHAASQNKVLWVVSETYLSKPALPPRSEWNDIFVWDCGGRKNRLHARLNVMNSFNWKQPIFKHSNHLIANSFFFWSFLTIFRNKITTSKTLIPRTRVFHKNNTKLGLSASHALALNYFALWFPFW